MSVQARRTLPGAVSALQQQVADLEQRIEGIEYLLASLRAQADGAPEAPRPTADEPHRTGPTSNDERSSDAATG
jgi:hypothetical protein